MAQGPLALPQELWIHIMSNLDAISLTLCATTCKFLYKTLKSSSQLSYIIQLYLDGFLDAGTFTPHSELIQRLLHHRKGWLSLAINNELEYVTLDMKHSCQAYELVGGTFADANKQQFEVVWLPSTFNDGESRTLRTATTDIPMSDFAMDPTQDLIVFLEDDAIPSSPTATRTVRVHIRTISTNNTHPLARQSPLQFTVPADPVNGNTIHNALLQLARNTLAFYFCTRSQVQPQVHIWDWTTSDLLVDSSTSIDPLLPPSRYDFGLLDSSHCFVTSQTGSGSIRLYKLPQFSSATGVPVHLATLHFPPISRGTVVFTITPHAGPIEASPQPHMPFMINDEDRIHVFTVVYHQTDSTPHSASLNMFVHQHTLTKSCTQGTQRRLGDAATSPLNIPWAKWGPRNTHLIAPAVTQSHWQRYVHGQRVIYPTYSRDDDEGSRRVKILDFSRAAVHKVSATRDPSKRSMPWSTVHTWEFPFLQKHVSTYLPFVTYALGRLKYTYSTFMIYGDGIVGVIPKPDDSLLLHAYPVFQAQTHPGTLVD